MAEILRSQELAAFSLQGQTVAVVGYGSQGRAHALNLRDEGLRVIAGIRPGGPSEAKAREDGMEAMTASEAAAQADVLMLSTQDAPMAGLYERDIAPHLRDGSLLLFAHGFAVVFGGLKPAAGLDVGLIGPKGPGTALRSEYLAGRGLPCLAAVHQEATGRAWERTLAYAAAIGARRASVFKTTFREETVSDLFGEQAVLCGGIPDLLKAGYEVLVEAGVQPELAYFECVHEAKLIVDLIYARGFAGMRQAISDTAEWGGQTTGPNVIGPEAKSAMRQTLSRIVDGSFAAEWIEESASGAPRLLAGRQAEAGSSVEEAGAAVRREIPFLNQGPQ